MNMPERQRETAQDLHHAEILVDVGLVARRAVGMRARHDLRAHGVGDDVLQHDADDGQKLRRDVEHLGRRERDPLSRRRPRAGSAPTAISVAPM